MSFDEEFVELAELAYRTAYRIVGVRADADDIAQETLAKALQRWSKVQGHARPWVCRVAANDAIGRLRKLNRRSSKLWIVAAPTAPDATSIARLDLQRVLLGLPRRQREVIVLRYVCDLKESEVADELGLSLGTVKTHARRGLASLRAQIVDEHESLPTELPEVIPNA